MTRFHLYDDADPCRSIMLDDLLHMQRQDVCLWAHAEASGSESCYCEVARWNYDAAPAAWQRFAWCKLADTAIGWPHQDDAERARGLAEIINGGPGLAPIVHGLPNYSEEAARPEAVGRKKPEPDAITTRSVSEDSSTAACNQNPKGHHHAKGN
jgi:hypothetical protein